jgi:hypothetical protein
VNRDWSQVTGYPNVDYDFQTSSRDAKGNLIVIGNSYNVGEAENFLITKYSPAGAVIWQKEYNGTTNKTDFGTDVICYGNYIYVSGVSWDTVANTSMFITLQFDTNGTRLWGKAYKGAFNGYNFPTKMVTDNSGNVFVVGTSQTAANDYAMVTLKYNPSGVLQWTNVYDSVGLSDGAGGIRYNSATNKITVYGASGSTTSNWDFILQNINPSTGASLDRSRVNNSNAYFAKPTDIVKDANDFIYATGTITTGANNSDIKVIKLDTFLNVVWTRTIDGGASKNDEATAMKLDSKGNILITGSATKADNTKEAWLLKLNNAGTTIWDRRRPSTVAGKDAQNKEVDVDKNGNIYTAGKVHNGSNFDFLTQAYDSSGTLKWEKTYTADTTTDDEAQDISVDTAGGVTVSGRNKVGANWRYTTVKYSTFSMPQVTINNSIGKPILMANELIVRFKQVAINKNAIDDKINTKQAEFGDLSYFLTQSADSIIRLNLSNLCNTNTFASSNSSCVINAVKIFKELKTSDTTTVSRMGEIIKIPDFWTTLLLIFPNGMDIKEVQAKFSQLPSIIAYSEYNYIASLTSGSNDSLYSVQKSIHLTNIDSNANINIEEAWDIVPSGGSSKIKGGVLDSGIDWTHQDFGYDGSNSNSSKIVGGWSFQNNSALKTNLIGDSLGHGTKCSGIIGAIRNNNIGIAGIAGGNYTGSNSLSDKGVALYGLKIFGTDFYSNSLNYIADAIVSSSIDDSIKNYAFGLNFTSNSWKFNQNFPAFTDSNITLIVEAIHFANRAKVTTCVARGNNGKDDLSYPAIIDDDWILNVGGTGLNGDYKYITNGDPIFEPSYGHDLDVSAPCTSEIILSLKTGGGYASFNGTSAAAPHVAGVVSLLMSYIDSSSPSYKNLAPEDCEHIIELSATDINETSYDSLTGWGRLNAGKALQLVKKPWNTVGHFGTKSVSSFTKTKSTIASNKTIRLLENYQNEVGIWFKKGKYRVNIFEIDAVVNNSLSVNDSIIAFWARPSSSNVLESLKGDSLLPRERVKINTCTNSSCSMIGYIYQVSDTIGNPLGWWPFDTTLSKSQFEYTILSHNRLASNVEESNSTNSRIFLHPNPTSSEQKILIESEKEVQLSIDLFDISGRLIKQIYLGKVLEGSNTISTNIAFLANGIYMYEIILGNEVKHIKFIKQ